MAKVIAFPTQVTVPVEFFVSGTNGLLVFSPGVFSSQDLEASDIRLAKLNSVCEEIELLKLTFELLKRSTDLSAKTGQIEALEKKNDSTEKTKVKVARNYRKCPLVSGRGEEEKVHTSFAFERKRR